MDRRQFLKTSTAAFTAAGVGAAPWRKAIAQAGPIKIGLLAPLTGVVASGGKEMVEGVQFYLDHINSTIAGRKVELVIEDDASNPDTALQKARRLVEQGNCHMLIGNLLANTGLAVANYVKGTGTPYFIPIIAADDLTQRQRIKNVIRVAGYSASAFTHPFGDWALKQGYKKIATVSQDYTFGHEQCGGLAQVFTEGGGEIVQQFWHPLNTADFSSFILKIRQAKPDVVVGGLSAGDLSTFLKQWNELGMRGKIPFVEIAIGDTDIWAVGPEAATGTFTKLWYYKNPNNPPEEKAFAAAYEKKHGRPAADKAWMGWITARSLFESIDAVKSTSPMAIVEGLEAWKVQAGNASYSYRKFDHQMLVRNLAVSVKDKITDKWDYFDVKATLPENVADLDKVFGTQDEIGCKMG